MQYRVRLHWTEIGAALELLRSEAVGWFHGTIDGNFPVIDCDEKTDAERVATTVRGAEVSLMTGTNRAGSA